MTIVDIHCHTFNADDLPVKGFVKSVVGNRHWLARALARAIDRVFQGMATGAEELHKLDELIERGPGFASPSRPPWIRPTTRRRRSWPSSTPNTHC